MQVKQQSVNQGESVHRESGYTLMEVICAVLIASIAASVLFVGFDNGFAILRTTREDLRATQILMQKTEAFRLYTWEQLTQANTPGTFKEYYYPNVTGSNSPGTLYWGTVSTLAPATNIPDSALYKSNIHLITVTVVWTNYNGTKAVGHSRKMQTLSAMSGMQNYLSSTNR
jgi:prepilin-type N-terminal cleavage/methylation domain-containing protein